MNTTLDTRDSATIVMATGRLDFEASDPFQKELETVIAQAATRHAAVLVNCAGIDYVSSAGLRVFLVAARSAKAANVALSVYSLSVAVKQVFDVSGFGRIINVYEDEASALAGVGSAA